MASNVTELRNELLKMAADLKSGAIEVKVAAEINNTVGKVINTVKAELEYASLRGDKPSIKFLEGSSE